MKTMDTKNVDRWDSAIWPLFVGEGSAQEGERLRVLLLDDKLSPSVAIKAIVGEFMDLYIARDPVAIYRALRNAVPRFHGWEDETEHTAGGASVGLPFDVILADYGLSESVADFSAERREAGFEVTTFGDDVGAAPPEAWESGELRTEFGPEDFEKSKDALAAGFTTAILMALNFHGYPAAIIPYSGELVRHQKESTLLRMLAPPTLFVGSEVTWSKYRDFYELLLGVPLGYRNALYGALKSGSVRIVNFRELRKAGRRFIEASEASREEWIGEATFVVESVKKDWSRTLQMKSLWFDLRDDDGRFRLLDGQANKLCDYINQITMPPSVEKQAIALTKIFWDAYRSEEGGLPSSFPNRYHLFTYREDGEKPAYDVARLVAGMLMIRLTYHLWDKEGRKAQDADLLMVLAPYAWVNLQNETADPVRESAGTIQKSLKRECDKCEGRLLLLRKLLNRSTEVAEYDEQELSILEDEARRIHGEVSKAGQKSFNRSNWPDFLLRLISVREGYSHI